MFLDFLFDTSPSYIEVGDSVWARLDKGGSVGYSCTKCGTWRTKGSSAAGSCSCNQKGPGLGTEDRV